MARRKGRRSFGSMRQLPSGRWQARYRDLAGVQHTAPQTFATRPEAARFPAQVETDLARGEWTGLELAAVSPNTVAKAYRLLARIMDTAVEAGMIMMWWCS